jgi:hypothetical protein
MDAVDHNEINRDLKNKKVIKRKRLNNGVNSVKNPEMDKKKKKVGKGKGLSKR